MKIYAMTTGREGWRLHAVPVFGPNPSPPRNGCRSHCGVYVTQNAGDWNAGSSWVIGNWCPGCVRLLRKSPPADPRVAQRAKGIHTEMHVMGGTMSLEQAVRIAREQIAAEDALHEAHRERRAAEACEPSSLATEALTLGCQPERGTARHEVLAPKVREAVERAVRKARLGEDQRPLSWLLRRAVEGEDDPKIMAGDMIDDLIGTVVEAVGEVLVESTP